MGNEKVYFLVAGSESTFPIDLTDIHQNFVRQLQGYFPHNPVQWVGLEEVREGLSQKVGEVKQTLPNAAVVTLSRLYYPAADYEISANRIVDTYRQPLGLGPRPSSEPLHRQVEKLMVEVGDRPVVTVDDTLFHGDTLSTLTKLGLRVNAAVEYFSSFSAMRQMESEGHPVHTVVGLDDYLDVMPIHDFLPSLPLCGKVVGCESWGRNYPLIRDGFSFSIPYLLPWVKPQELESWASVPVEHTKDFSEFALEQAVRMMGRLWRFGFTTLRHAAESQPLRVSLPFLPGHTPDVDAGLTIVLRRYLHLLRQEDV